MISISRAGVSPIPAQKPATNAATRQEKSAPLSGRKTACVIDLDNVCSRRGLHGKRAWAYLDVIAFIATLRERGVTKGAVFQNQKPGDCGSKLWAAAGLKCVATGRNVDELVKLAAVDYALEGLNCLILVASDGGYDEVIHAIRRCGVRVELWALRTAVASHLVFAADAVRWMDDLLQEPEMNRPARGRQAVSRTSTAA